mmetsp:Transcript_21726/g.69962  ORF Transcript_21726/g.69962 Transcript_21726/m.69962 type:complete len:238 (+) Transcript_21726:254-967(+)
MGDEWAESAATWDDDPIVRFYSEEAFRMVEEKVAPLLDLSASTVLDVGCGTGLLSRKLASRCLKVVSVDPSEAMVRQCRDKSADVPNMEIICGVVDDVADRRFDLAVASSVCAFVDDYVAFLRTVARTSTFFLQLDWRNDRATLGDYGAGFSETLLDDCLRNVGFTPKFLGNMFEIKPDEDTPTGYVIGALAERPISKDDLLSSNMDDDEEDGLPEEVTETSYFDCSNGTSVECIIL